ncbi:fasciclin domain-containing protein [Flavobacterium sp. N1994]|uniref:fasciclin domain-containing protein n=1 Tax=Flavobacterium sp. N1994 TaxID=2986827 RepID=UPI002221C5F1|nr:fasciclin domain-containing protein [Flavobacterium sp. N1994]
MKKSIKNAAIILLAFVAFSCSDEGNTALKKSSIGEIARATPQLSSFVEALDITGLTSTFDNAGDYTVLAPDDAAFDAVLSAFSEPDLATLEADYPGLLAKVLKYHVVSSSVLSTSLSNDQSVSTLFEQPLTVSIIPVDSANPATYPGQPNFISFIGNNTTTPSSANVTARDVKCTNGVIHTIDAVLIPAGL